jgi:hypothetical protein
MFALFKFDHSRAKSISKEENAFLVCAQQNCGNHKHDALLQPSVIAVAFPVKKSVAIKAALVLVCIHSELLCLLCHLMDPEICSQVTLSMVTPLDQTVLIHVRVA